MKRSRKSAIKQEKATTNFEVFMENKKSTTQNILRLAAGELILSVAVVAVFAALGEFSYKVITGVLLGSAAAIANFVFLTVTINRAVDRFMALRGDGEMSEEEADAFTAKNAGEIQNAQKLSFLLRTFTLLGALVLAFISKQFNVIATVIPLLAFQPILIISQQIGANKK